MRFGTEDWKIVRQLFESKKNISLTDWLDKKFKEMKRSIKSHDDATSVFSGLDFSKYCTCCIMQIISYLNLIKSTNKI